MTAKINSDTIMEPKTPKPMKTTTNEPQPTLKPHRLRDDPHWQGHYNAILTGLYSRFEEPDYDAYESPKEGFEALETQLEHLAFIAYQGACHAHCHAHLAEPPSEEEIAQFNASINVNNKSGDGQ
jgi:hypothetical protein